MRNWRTTISGLLLIAGGTATFVGMWIATKTFPDGSTWGALGVAYTAGAGLIAAADGKPKDPPQ